MALTNTQYDAILKEYAVTRDANRALSMARAEEVFRVLPEVAELNDSVSALSVAAARSVLSGDDAALTRLHEQLARIDQKRKALLTSAGFPEDYLEPVFDCPHCKDTGYVTGEDGLKEKCSCFRRREIAVLYSQTNIRELLAKENFSTLSYEYYQGEDLQRFENAAALSKDFTKKFNQDYTNILFYGTVGTGKSFLSGCIAKELVDQGHSVIYFSASTMFDLLARYAFDRKDRQALQEFYDDLYSCDLLIIDDLGTEYTNDFVSSQLFSCLNERHLGRKSTIISTNLSLAEIRDRYSERIFSRISSSFELCKLTGQDIRIYKKRMQNK